jgi:hypothetical protein
MEELVTAAVAYQEEAFRSKSHRRRHVDVKHELQDDRRGSANGSLKAFEKSSSKTLRSSMVAFRRGLRPCATAQRRSISA